MKGNRVPKRPPSRGKAARHGGKKNKVGRKSGEYLTAKPEVLQGVNKPHTMRLSKSKIGGLDWCQYSWALDNIMGIKASSAHYTTFGIDCHQIVEEYYRAMMACETEEAILDLSVDFDYESHPTITIDDKMREHLDNVLEIDRKRIDTLLAAGVNLLDYARPVAVELYMKVPDKTDIKNGEISGMIDLVFRELDGTIGIYDLKTGKISDVNKHYFQLHLYKWMFESLNPDETVSKIGILWSKDGTMDIAEPNKRSYNSAIKKIQTTRDKIKLAVMDSTEDNPISGFKKALRNPVPCSYCPIEHKRICWKEQYDVDLE